MKPREVTVRTTTLAGADDRARDFRFWQSRPAAERFLQVFQMSEEAYAFVGKLLPIPPDARDLLRAFCAHDVRFLVIGAHAVGYWGQPRATGDFDLLVEPTAENGRKVLAALEEFGAPLFDLSLEDLSRPGMVFQMGVPPYRIDLSTELTGVPFEEAWAGRATLELEGLTIPILGRAELVRNKRATDRPKDRFDLDLLGEG